MRRIILQGLKDETFGSFIMNAPLVSERSCANKHLKYVEAPLWGFTHYSSQIPYILSWVSPLRYLG
jgi:hypothetical protein